MEYPAGYCLIAYQTAIRISTLLALAYLPLTVTLQAQAQSLPTDCVVNVNSFPAMRTTLPIQPLDKPVIGQSAVDPAHGTCITRLTDNKATSGIRFLRHIYSRSQAFNADNTRMLAFAGGGFWHLIDTATAQDISILPKLAGDAEPQWHKNDPNILYFLPDSGGLNIQQLNIATGEISILADFTGRLPWSQAARVWTRAEGSPSADQRFWAFIVETEDFKGLGMIVWDRRYDTIVGSIDFAEEGLDKPDHVSMSPTGEYVVASWFPPQGTVAFTRDFSRQVRLAGSSEHSDLALLQNDRDALVSVNYQSNDGNVYYTDIEQAMATGVADQVTLFSTYLNGSANSRHISGKAFRRPGWALMSVYGERHNVSPDRLTRQWHDDRVFAVELKPQGRVINLAHHRSDVFDDYWQEPHATVNRDFTALIFASDWGSTGALDVDSYLIDGLQWIDEPTGQECNIADPALQRKVRSGVWSLLSLPCKPPAGVGVSELFGDDVPGELGQGWSVQFYDPVTNQYAEATADSELSQGEGFWFMQVSGEEQTLDLPAGSTRWSPSPTAAGCAGSGGCGSVALDGSLSPTPWQIIGNPVPGIMPVDTVSVSAPAGPCGSGAACNLTEASDATSADLVRTPLWRFDDSASTPAYQPAGAGDVLAPWEGLWIIQGAEAESNAPQLHFPFGE